MYTQEEKIIFLYKVQIYFPCLISWHSSGRRVFLTQILGAQQGLAPNLHGTQCLPASRLPKACDELSCVERNAVAVYCDTSKLSSLLVNTFLP